MNNLVSRISKAGLLVGTLDIVTACIYFTIKTGGDNPLRVLRFVASGLVGKSAFSDGTSIIFLGLVLHYLIAFSFTAFFFSIYPNIKLLSKNKIATGIVYGIFIWVVMNLVIVPLSQIGSRPFDFINALINAIILIVCIGIPLSVLAKRFHENQKGLNLVN